MSDDSLAPKKLAGQSERETIRREVVPMTAADLGCWEQKCQHGRGDPPMDCIWPDCGCGLRLSSKEPEAPPTAVVPWTLTIWVIYQSDRPFDYRFSRADAFKRAKELRETTPSGEWSVKEQCAALTALEGK